MILAPKERGGGYHEQKEQKQKALSESFLSWA